MTFRGTARGLPFWPRSRSPTDIGHRFKVGAYHLLFLSRIVFQLVLGRVRMKPLLRLAVCAVLVSFTFGAQAQDDEMKSLMKNYSKCYRECRFGEALGWARRATERWPNEYFGPLYAGSAQLMLKLPESAIASDNKALQTFKAGKCTVAPEPASEATIISRRALGYYELGELAKCRKDFDAALAIDGKDANTWILLGKLLGNGGEYDKALEAIATAEKLDDGAKEETRFIIGERARVLRHKGDYDGARAEVQKLIDKGDWDGGVDLALIEAQDPKVHDLKKAREIFDEAARGHEVDREPGRIGAILLVLEGRPEAAVAAFDEVPDVAMDVELIFYDGLAQLQVGASDRAIEL